MADEHTRVPWWRRKMLSLDAMRNYPAVEEMGPPRPLRAIHVEEMRLAARAWRGALPRNQSIHDRVDDLIDEIDRLRKRVEAADRLADRVEKAESGWPHRPGWVSEALAAYRATEGQTDE